MSTRNLRKPLASAHINRICRFATWCHILHHPYEPFQIALEVRLLRVDLAVGRPALTASPPGFFPAPRHEPTANHDRLLAPETLYRVMQLTRDPIPTWEALNDSCVDGRIMMPEFSRGAAPLLAASLVCRRWREPAQRALWTDARPLKEPAVWLSSPARGRYIIRHLWIHNDWGLRTSLGGALASCAGLKALALSSEEGVDVPWAIFRCPSLAGTSALPLTCGPPPADGIFICMGSSNSI